MNQDQKIDQYSPECPKDWIKWVRFPQTGKEEHCGLTRAMAYKLASKGFITSASIRISERGMRGTRIFWLPSIHRYLNSVAAKTAEREILNNETEE